jgi:hypothetical protein
LIIITSPPGSRSNSRRTLLGKGYNRDFKTGERELCGGQSLDRRMR